MVACIANVISTVVHRQRQRNGFRLTLPQAALMAAIRGTTTMPHLALLGDSIFDNAAYVAGGPSLIRQVQQRSPPGWQASLFAVDGHTTADVHRQLTRLPRDATHLALSVGGNDALGAVARLETPAATVLKALDVLADIQTKFRINYRSLVATLLAQNRPLLVCTVYDAIPGLAAGLKTALALFNDVILREANERGLPVLDLRLVCTEPDDYSAKSPIEPSSKGGDKIATSLVTALARHEFATRRCSVYGLT
jgi:lysophospholipase L1-like esterase